MLKDKSVNELVKLLEIERRERISCEVEYRTILEKYNALCSLIKEQGLNTVNLKNDENRVSYLRNYSGNMKL